MLALRLPGILPPLTPDEAVASVSTCMRQRKRWRPLSQAMDESGLSARAHDRILKVARTIAEFDGRDDVGLYDISEAIGYLVLDRPA